MLFNTFESRTVTDDCLATWLRGQIGHEWLVKRLTLLPWPHDRPKADFAVYVYMNMSALNLLNTRLVFHIKTDVKEKVTQNEHWLAVINLSQMWQNKTYFWPGSVVQLSKISLLVICMEWISKIILATNLIYTFSCNDYQPKGTLTFIIPCEFHLGIEWTIKNKLDVPKMFSYFLLSLLRLGFGLGIPNFDHITNYVNEVNAIVFS